MKKNKTHRKTVSASDERKSAVFQDRAIHMYTYRK